MSNQLQSLAFLSLNKYESLLDHVPHFKSMFNHPGFIVRLVLDGEEVKFEPDFHDFEVILLNVFDVIVKAVMIVPCIETKLYSEWSGQKKFLKPNIADDIVDTLKGKIKELIENQSMGPINHAKLFNKFEQLITVQGDTDIEQFLREDHSFDEYIEKVKEYNDLVEEITYGCQKVILTDNFQCVFYHQVA